MTAYYLFDNIEVTDAAGMSRYAEAVARTSPTTVAATWPLPPPRR